MTPNALPTHFLHRHHFLYHIFRMDKAENPMPPSRAETVLQYVKRAFNDHIQNNQRRK